MIIFLMDCVRPDHMSCYGYRRETTPNLDRMVKEEGTLFRQAITTSGWTLPTHASLFTGVYPSLHGASKEYLSLDKTYPTMAEILGEVGYQTAGFSSVGYVSRATGLDRGFDAFFESFDKEGMGANLNRYMLKYLALRLLAKHTGLGWKDAIPGKIVNWKVKDWLRRCDRSRPFFLFIHYIDAHKPYSFNRFYNRKFIGCDGKLKLSKEISHYNWPHFTLQLDSLDKELITDLYDSKIYTVDYCISEIMDYLKRLGSYDNTAFFVMADHGEIVTDRYDHHFFLNEDVLRIPLLVRWPALFEPGTERDELVSIVDILPTLLDIAGVATQGRFDHLQGRTLLSSCDEERFVIAERGKMLDPWFEKFPELKERDDIPPLDCVMKVLRTKRYKYVWSSTGEEALYDVIADSAESEDLAAALPEVVEEYKGLLFETLKGGRNRSDRQKSTEVEETVRKSLESLGYL